MVKHNVPVWLVNTGWTGGPAGVGQRMDLQYTRALLKAVLEGSLNRVAFTTDLVFGLQIPKECPSVPASVLQPRRRGVTPKRMMPQCAPWSRCSKIRRRWKLEPKKIPMPTTITELPKLLPRQADSHKGTYGKVLVVAGSRGMTRAAILCGTAAMRSGAGWSR